MDIGTGLRAVDFLRMSAPIIIGMSLAYFGVALSETIRGHYGYALMFFCYGLANCGLIWEMK
jgi:hypothetical protein